MKTLRTIENDSFKIYRNLNDPCLSNGYLVLSLNGYSGNLVGLPGANIQCLKELVENAIDAGADADRVVAGLHGPETEGPLLGVDQDAEAAQVALAVVEQLKPDLLRQRLLQRGVEGERAGARPRPGGSTGRDCRLRRPSHPCGRRSGTYRARAAPS